MSRKKERPEIGQTFGRTENSVDNNTVDDTLNRNVAGSSPGKHRQKCVHLARTAELLVCGICAGTHRLLGLNGTVVPRQNSIRTEISEIQWCVRMNRGCLSLVEAAEGRRFCLDSKIRHS